MAKLDEQEKKLREGLSNQLGVEFYDPDDPEINETVAPNPVAGPTERPTGRIRKISVSDIIRQCNEVVAKLPDEDPNKILIWNCAFTIRQLLERLESPTVQ